MPRNRRISPDGIVQHIVNRGDHRETLFHKPGDFRAFLAVMTETALRVPMRILAYCIMRNHFHLLLWPELGEALPEFMQLLMNTHIRRYLRHYPPISPGHLYQGRYTNALVQDGPSVLAVARYVEANALTAGLVQRAQDYPWSSASPYAEDADRPTLAEWPVAKPHNWGTLLNLRAPAAERRRIQISASRGAPYGSDEWVRATVKAYGLAHTIRKPGRPRKSETLVVAGDTQFSGFSL
jgi:putative transposase